MVVDLRSTGSEFGLSKDLVSNACERRDWLDFQYSKTLPPEAIQPLYVEKADKRGKARPVANTVGTAFHALAERWYTGENFRIEDVRFTWYGTDIEESHPVTCSEARRLFTAYALKYSQHGMGRIDGIEVQLKAPLHLFGCAKTGAADLAIEMMDAEMVHDFETKRQVMLPGLGYYLVDIKTDDRDEGEKTVQEYMLRAQFPLYCMMWEAQFPDKPLRGMIVDVIFKTSEVGFKTLFLPTPTHDEREMVRNIVQLAHKARTSEEPPTARAGACISYGRVCGHFTAGRCPRY